MTEWPEYEISLDDCVNWDNNLAADCGGRMSITEGEKVCETCYNRRNSAVRGEIAQYGAK